MVVNISHPSQKMQNNGLISNLMSDFDDIAQLNTFLDNMFFLYVLSFSILVFGQVCRFSSYAPYSFGALARARAPMPWGSAACGASPYIF